MNKTLKTVLIVLLVVVLVGACIGGYFIYRHQTSYIGSKDALAIALDASGLEKSAVKETDVEFDKNAYSAWYEVDIDTFGMDYEYIVYASTGEILNSSVKPD